MKLPVLYGLIAAGTVTTAAVGGVVIYEEFIKEPEAAVSDGGKQIYADISADISMVLSAGESRLSMKLPEASVAENQESHGSESGSGSETPDPSGVIALAETNPIADPAVETGEQQEEVGPEKPAVQEKSAPLTENSSSKSASDGLKEETKTNTNTAVPGSAEQKKNETVAPGPGETPEQEEPEESDPGNADSITVVSIPSADENVVQGSTQSSQNSQSNQDSQSAQTVTPAAEVLEKYVSDPNLTGPAKEYWEDMDALFGELAEGQGKTKEEYVNSFVYMDYNESVFDWDIEDPTGGDNGTYSGDFGLYSTTTGEKLDSDLTFEVAEGTANVTYEDGKLTISDAENAYIIITAPDGSTTSVDFRGQ